MVMYISCHGATIVMTSQGSIHDYLYLAANAIWGTEN